MQLFVFSLLPNDNASLYKNAGGNVQHGREHELGGLHAQRSLVLLECTMPTEHAQCFAEPR